MKLKFWSGLPPLTPIQNRIFNELTTGQSLSRMELLERISIPGTTISDNLAKLQSMKVNGTSLVMCFVKYRKGVGPPVLGRPMVYWYIPRVILRKLNGGE